MNITKIVVSHQETASLGDYSNVKPSATIEVTLAEGDDLGMTLAEAQALVRQAVQRDVDDALEAHGRPARYSTEARYTLFTRHNRVKDGLPNLAVIGPSDAAYHPSLSRSYRNYRLPAIRRLATEHYGHAAHEDQQLLIDTTQDPDALVPVLERLIAEEAQLEAEREKQRQEQQRRDEEWKRRYAAQQAAAEEDADSEADEDDDD